MIKMLNKAHKKQGFTIHFEDLKGQDLEAQGEAEREIQDCLDLFCIRQTLGRYLHEKQYQL